MSYNPPPNNGPPYGQPPRGNPMLPPQLANLTPQQLQQLRNQPQFQKIMKSYLQRQQMLQAQMGGPGPQGGPVPPGGSMPPGAVLPPGAVPQAIPPGAQMPPQALAPGRAGPMAIPPAAPAMNAMPKPQQEPPKPSNGVPPEIMSRIPLTHMSAPDEWSKKLKAKGKPVPPELRVYESIVANENKSASRNARQNEAKKKTTESLLKDVRSYNEIKQLRMNAIALSSKGQFSNSIWGEGYQGYGNGVTNTATQLILPPQRKRFSKAPESIFTERQLNQKLLARLKYNPRRALVPIRLEFDSERDRFKLRDTFLWDMDEDEMSLEAFVTTLLEDYKIISPHHIRTILASVKDQIKDYHQKPEKAIGELRVPIKIDVTIHNTQLIDQFEWDILNFEDNDPEEFASVFCDEMQLPGEFATAIAHSIREQTHMFHKSLFLVGYSFDGSVVTEDEIRSHVLPSLRQTSQDYSRALIDDYYSILRNPSTVPDYTPTLIKLSQVELERLDKEIERESRRKRRHNANEDASGGRGASRRNNLHGARGGPVLPDLTDIPKTFRTPQPSSVLPGGIDLFVPSVNNYNEVIVHRTQIANTGHKAQASRGPRVTYNHDPLQGRFQVRIRTRGRIGY